MVRQGGVHRLAELSACLVVQLLVARVCARSELINCGLELVVPVTYCKLAIPTNKQFIMILQWGICLLIEVDGGIALGCLIKGNHNLLLE